MKAALFIAGLWATAATADVVVAARNLAPGEILQESDALLIRGEVPGAFDTVPAVVGREARVALYAGRAILKSQLDTAATVERNQIIEIVYTATGLRMQTEGRALGRGAAGDRIRVMNLSSKASFFGTIQDDGSVRVSN